MSNNNNTKAARFTVETTSNGGDVCRMEFEYARDARRYLNKPFTGTRRVVKSETEMAVTNCMQFNGVTSLTKDEREIVVNMLIANGHDERAVLPVVYDIADTVKPGVGFNVAGRRVRDLKTAVDYAMADNSY